MLATMSPRRRSVLQAGVAGFALSAAVLTVVLDSGQAVSSASPPTVVAPPRVPSATPLWTNRASGSPAAIDRPSRESQVTLALDTLLGDHKDDVSAYAVDLRTGRTVSYGRSSGLATASMVKLDILLTLLLQEQDEGTLPSAGETSLATQMITESDNDAASDLWSVVGADSGVAAANRRFGLTETVPGPSSYWGSTTTGAADQVRLFRQVVGSTSLLAPAYRAYALRLLQAVEPDQRWGVGAAADAGTADPTLANKNGWLPRPVDGGRWVVTSVGRVTAGGDPLVLAVLTRRSSSMDVGITTVESVARALRDALVGSPASAPSA